MVNMLGTQIFQERIPVSLGASSSETFLKIEPGAKPICCLPLTCLDATVIPDHQLIMHDLRSILLPSQS